MRRFQLTLRRVTHRGQKLSGHLRQLKNDTTNAINKRFGPDGTLHGMDPHYFLNMDQTAVYFESKSRTIVARKGKKSVCQRDSGCDAKRATVVVTVAADGTKLEPFFIFKARPGKKVEQQILDNGIKGACQVKGWFDSVVAKKWIEQILEPYVVNAEKALLLVDHFSVHLTSDFLSSCADLGVDVEYIPKGYTCVLQPVDVGFNAQLKKHIRDKHHQWCITTYRGLPNAAKIPTPEREQLIEWVRFAYNNIQEESIVRTFKYIGYWTGGDANAPEDEASEASEVNIQDLLQSDEDTEISRDILLLPRPNLWRQVNNINEGDDNANEEIVNLKSQNNNDDDEESNDGDEDEEGNQLYLLENDGYGYESE
jgi:DDE superfamily endonuclease